MSVRLLTLSGKAIQPYLSDLARLRITVFREFPYLYDGDLAYEQDYLQTYSQSENILFVLVLDGEKVVGASTGIPLLEADREMREPFLQQDTYPPEQLFYFGESVLLTEYRGRGLGKRFFAEREAFAKKLDSAFATFCAVERPEYHPLRPADYPPLDNFWQQQGYAKQEELSAFYSWKDIDEDAERPKKMIFWVKKLT